MRIIAGELRGRRIAAPPGRATRPMLDRVREALFSSLAPRLPGARVLDLFAGSGSLGLEALSRGARETRFVERDRETAARLAANVESLGLGARSRVVVADALAAAAWGEERRDLVLLDPPYALVADRARRARLLGALSTLLGEVVEPDGAVVLHAPRRALGADELAAAAGDARVRERVYGTNALWYVERETPGRAPRVERA